MIVEDDYVLGYEFVGEVIVVYFFVKYLKIGDCVVVELNVLCYVCEFCFIGWYNGCDNVEFLLILFVWGFLCWYVNYFVVWCYKIGEMLYENGVMLEFFSVVFVGM